MAFFAILNNGIREIDRLRVMVRERIDFVLKSGTSIGCLVCVHDFRNIKEEIVVQQFGDAYQHGEVDTLPLEHLVNNTVVAVDGFREPPHRAPLRHQLCPYHPANMYFLLIYGHKKIVNFGYLYPRFSTTCTTK